MSSTEKAAAQSYRENPSPTTLDGHVLPSPNDTINDHVVIVDWNGPDDPENPRKWVVYHCIVPSFFVSLYI